MTTKNKGGRPSKITPEITKEIADYIRAGNYPETAAELAGISKRTFYYWLKRGFKSKTGIHKEFLHTIKEAEAYAEGAAVERIRVAGDKNWQALAWWLERKYPDKWGRMQKVELEHSGQIEQKQEVTINKESVFKRVDKVVRYIEAEDLIPLSDVVTDEDRQLRYKKTVNK